MTKSEKYDVATSRRTTFSCYMCRKYNCWTVLVFSIWQSYVTLSVCYIILKNYGLINTISNGFVTKGRPTIYIFSWKYSKQTQQSFDPLTIRHFSVITACMDMHDMYTRLLYKQRSVFSHDVKSPVRLSHHHWHYCIFMQLFFLNVLGQVVVVCCSLSTSLPCVISLFV